MKSLWLFSGSWRRWTGRGRRRIRNLDLAAKLLLPIGLIVFLSHLLAIGFNIGHSFRTARREALEKNVEMANRYAAEIANDMDGAANTARSLANVLTTMRQERAYPDRQLLIRFVRRFLEANPQLLGAWTVWEPNALDGLDQKFRGAPGHSENGRFVPYWNRVGGLRLEPCVDYDTPGPQSDYYTVPMTTGRETVIDPTTYVIGDRDVEVVSVVSPIRIGGRSLGVAGVDLSMQKLSQMVARVHPFDAGHCFLMTNGGEVVAHPDPAHIGQPGFSDPEVLAAVRAGETRSWVRDADPVNGQRSFMVISPIDVGHTGTPWSLAISVPVRRVLADAFRLRNNAILIAAISLLLILALVSWIIRAVLTRPIRRMARSFNDIASGRESLETPLSVESEDEMGELATAFNQMADRLKAVMRSLQEERDYSRELLQVAPGPILSIRPDGALNYLNPAGERLIGLSADEAVNRPVHDLLALSEPEFSFPCLFRRDLAGLNSRESEVESLDGHHATVLWNFTLRRNRDGLPVELIAFGNDITGRRRAEREKRELEHRLQQSQKMEAIGNLAGGIAHDFNNILAPIMGFSELALRILPEEEKVAGYLWEIHSAAQRARELVTQILTFCRGGRRERGPIQMEVVVKEVLKLLRASLPKLIDIRESIPDHCPPALANPTHIHQIVMNLVTNAAHAIGDRPGVIEIRLEATRISDRSAEGLVDGDYLRLIIRDSGDGIPEEVRDRIFEPYFTTKAEGKGTGMGLAIVYGIVRDYGGNIQVFSRRDEGTTVSVYLPSGDRVSDPETTDPRSTAIPQGTERVVLVDDEASVARVVARMLREAGYQATVYNRAIAARDDLRENPRGADLLVTDLSMAELSGLDLARDVLRRRPDLPVILYSGSLDALPPETLRNAGIGAVLAKPFTQLQLARTVRAALDAAKAAAPAEERMAEWNRGAVASPP
ncbi:MAG: ATP-binding protein [Desulfococcaceae bacterium]